MQEQFGCPSRNGTAQREKIRQPAAIRRELPMDEMGEHRGNIAQNKLAAALAVGLISEWSGTKLNLGWDEMRLPGEQ
jgi:hypothetical protein